MGQSKHDLADRIRAAGMRATQSRIAVLRLLERQAAPMSHPEVSDTLDADGYDKASLFRCLNDLAEAGILRRFDAGDHVWRFELDTSQHAHFVCIDCGEVSCIDGLELSGGTQAPRAIHEGTAELQLRGVCDDCHG